MAAVTTQPKKRIDSIDILRGIIMVIMAIDHTRDFFMPQLFDPTDLSKASTALFLTRFITHFCAPIFIFLSGTGAFLSLNRGKTKGQASLFLLTRGLWLILLEVTFINAGFFFEFLYHPLILQVFWALGISMIVLAGLIWLPARLIAAFGLILIFGHNAFDAVKFGPPGSAGDVTWTLLHVQAFENIGGLQVMVAYPVIPWIGVMAVGYVFGNIFKMDAAKRRTILLSTGISALVLFVIIRYMNVYGNLTPWTDQHIWYRTVLSFINVTKYPPSLDYLLVTLGVANLALAAFENAQGRFANAALVFGRIPLFYYLAHIVVLRIAAISAFLIFKPAPGDKGSLLTVYIFWALIIVILYFPCRWYMKYKATHRHWWLSYL